MRLNPFYDFLTASGQGLVSFFSASGFVLELLLSVILFTWKIKRKKGWAWKGLLCLAALLAIGNFWATYVPANAATTIVRCLVFYAGLFFTMWVCLESDVRHLLLYLVAGVTAQHFIYCGAQVTTYGLVKLIGPAGETSWLSLVLYPLCLIPFFVLAYLLFARRIAWQSLDVVIGARILALIIGVFLCVTIFASLYNGSTTGEQVSPLIFVTFIMTRMITCGFLLELMTEIGDRFATIHESAVLQQLLNEQKNKLAADKETIELINVKTHDLKKQLNLLGGKIPDEQIQDLGRLVSFYDSSIHSGNEALDVLLTNKSLICTERSIQLERMIDGSKLSFMKPQDIYSLFGNALDNAIEAVSKISDPSRRYIRMTVREDKGMVIFHIENPYEGVLTYRDNNNRIVRARSISSHADPDRREKRVLRTSKEDKRYHGFGVQSIRLVAQQYKGLVTINAHDGLFLLDVLIPRSGGLD